MLELPECVTIARQLDEALRGRTIARACRGNSPHKFAFFKPSIEALETGLPGRGISAVSADGKAIYLYLRPRGVLSFSEMDARLLLNAPGADLRRQPAALPKRYQFLVEFDDASTLTVTISLWGFIGMEDDASRAASAAHSAAPGIDPLSKEFSLSTLRGLLSRYEKQTAPLKAFLINRPSIKGFGNGYMQEILFHAGIRPTRAVGDLTAEEQRRLHRAIRSTLADAVKRGGSEDERDIHGSPGGYGKMLGARIPRCKVCGAGIQKKSFLGGATYWCPKCQR